MPVFMKVCAGSWLIASVTIERMMQMSSATVARWGKIGAQFLAALAAAAERMLGSQTDQLRALKLCDRHATRERLRHRLARHLGEVWLIVERLQVRRAAGHVEVDDPLDLGSVVERMNDAAPALGWRRTLWRFGVGAAQQAGVEQRRQRQRAESRSSSRAGKRGVEWFEPDGIRGR